MISFDPTSLASGLLISSPSLKPVDEEFEMISRFPAELISSPFVDIYRSIDGTIFQPRRALLGFRIWNAPPRRERGIGT